MTFLENLEGLLSSKLEIAKSFWTLIKLESKLAGLSIFPLLINLAILIGLCFTGLLSLFLLIGYGVFWATQNYLISILSIIIINGVFLFFVAKLLSIYIKRMSFEKTRACLQSDHGGDKHEVSKKTAHFNRTSRRTVVSRKKKTSSP
jgi:hypothetical protein